jgi:hypothetical protein
VHDLADPGLRQSGRLREAVLADSQRLKELGEKDLTRVMGSCTFALAWSTGSRFGTGR